MLFSRWGAFVYRFRRPIAILTIVLAIAAALVAARCHGRPDRRRLARPELRIRGGQRRGSPTSSAPGAAHSSPSSRVSRERRAIRAFQAAIAASLARLSADPRVDGVVGFAQTGDDRFISTDGDSAYVVVRLTITDEESVDAMDTLRALIDQPAGMTLKLAGVGPVHRGPGPPVRAGARPGRDGLAARSPC